MMNIYTRKTNLNQDLILLNSQIDKTIADLGRLSSYYQSSTEVMSRIKLEKIRLLRSLKEKKINLIKLLEKQSEAII